MFRYVISLLLLASVMFGAVNINTATSAQLQTLEGVGPAKAQEIIKYRRSHAGFRSVDELVNVKGIGPKTLEKVKKQVSIR